MSTQCLNCGAELKESYHYCPNCSQKKETQRIHFHDLVHDAVHYFTHADKGIFQLLRALVIQNGFVAREYLDGKRKRYFPPLNFYLIVATVMVLSLTTLKNQEPKDTAKAYNELNNISDPVKRHKVMGIYERRDKALQFTSKYSNVLALIALPLIALVYWLFYVKARFNYVEHMIAGMYMNGFTNLFYLLIFAPLAQLLVGGQTTKYIFIYFIIQFIYCGIFYYRFINRSGTAALFKSFSVSLVSILIWALLTTSAISLYIANGFWGLIQ